VNANDQLLAETNKLNGSADGVNTYAYDSNGSLTNQVVGGTNFNMAYNLKNKLSTVTVGTTTCSYLYNDSGIRVSSTTGGTTNLYLVDPNNHTGYAQILEELNSPGGTPTMSYVIGDDVLGQCSTTGTDPRYRLADGHGSTRQMADISATVRSSYNYEAYGTAITGTWSGIPETSLRYCGEQFDSTLNMYNLRARFYNPVNGRFNARDSFKGNNEDPESLHKYAYGNCDPVNRIDPSGQFSLIQALVVISLAVIIIAALYVALGIGPFGVATNHYQNNVLTVTVDPVILIPQSYPNELSASDANLMNQSLSGASAYWKRWAGIEIDWGAIRIVRVGNADDANMETVSKLQTTVNAYYTGSPVVLGVEALDDPQTSGYTVKHGFGEINDVADSLTYAHEFGHLFTKSGHAHLNSRNLLSNGETQARAGMTLDNATLTQSQVDKARKVVANEGWVK